MSRMEPTIENIFGYKLQPHWGIIKLLKHFRDREKGLELIYLRYVFIKNQDRDRFDKKTFRHLEGFYNQKENNISYLYKQGDLDIKAKTPPGNSIINYLQKLVDLGIIYKPKKGFYKLREAYEKEVIKDEIRDCISSYDGNEIMEYENVENYEFEIGNLLFGMEKEIQEAFTDTEMKKIRENVKEVERLLIEIDRIYLVRSEVEGIIKDENYMREHYGFENEREVREGKKELIDEARMKWEHMNINNIISIGVNPLTFVRFSSLTTFVNKIRKKNREKEKRGEYPF